MFMADQDTLASASHSILLVVFLQSLQTGYHRWVLFWLRFFGAKCVVRERVEADGVWLVCGEGLGEDRAENRILVVFLKAACIIPLTGMMFEVRLWLW